MNLYKTIKNAKKSAKAAGVTTNASTTLSFSCGYLYITEAPKPAKATDKEKRCLKVYTTVLNRLGQPMVTSKLGIPEHLRQLDVVNDLIQDWKDIDHLRNAKADRNRKIYKEETNTFNLGGIYNLNHLLRILSAVHKAYGHTQLKYSILSETARITSNNHKELLVVLRQIAHHAQG